MPLHLSAAFVTHFCLFVMQKEALNNACSTVLNVLAKTRNFSSARFFQRKLEVYVFSQADLLVKKSSTTFICELLTAVLKATQHTCITRLDSRAQFLPVIIASI
mmetsp:Transcript_3073/g.7079  ORF Transcript_3073/g.7079 Transcript_3073/m.7079 type:complete len:104 (-) Transcript_3073:1322-1633(-)